MWETAGLFVVCLAPSPKSQAYVVMPPKTTDDEEASNDVAFPAAAVAAVKAAWGRWSGVMTMGPFPGGQVRSQIVAALPVSTLTTRLSVVTSIRLPSGVGARAVIVLPTCAPLVGVKPAGTASGTPFHSPLPWA